MRIIHTNSPSAGVSFQGVTTVPVSAGAIESCTLVGSGGTHAICSVSPVSAASSLPSLVHACSRTRLVSSLSLGPLLPDASAIGAFSSSLRISVRNAGISPTCPLLRIEAHSSDSKLVASANIFWNERSEQLVAHPAIQVCMHTCMFFFGCCFVMCLYEYLYLLLTIGFT